MPWTTGNVSTFSNKVITNEVLGTGNGSTTIFNFTLAKKPIFVSTFTFRYTIGSVVYNATTDAAGVITGTHISSASVTELGAVSATFSTAPDNATQILSPSYTTKGFLQKLLDWVAGNTYTQTVGTGDGSTVTFNFTVTNTPISKGNLRLEFKIGATTYKIFDNGVGGWTHAQISSSSINYASGVCSVTFAAAIFNAFAIKCFYCVGKNSGEEGRDWLVYSEQNSKDNAGTPADAFAGLLLKECVLKNSGLSYLANIAVGLREFQYVTETLYGLNLNGYLSYDEVSWNEDKLVHNLDNYDTTRKHWSELPKVTLNDTNMTYWISSTKNRIIAVVKVSASVYECFYIGHGIAFSAPSLYPNPLAIIGTSTGNISFSDTTTNHKFIIDPADSTAWFIIDNYNNYRHAAQGTNDPKVLPKSQSAGTSGTIGKTSNNKVISESCYVYDENTGFLLFELDGVKFCPCSGLQSEDTITDGSKTYFVVQDIHRTGFADYAAIEQV